MSAKKSTVERWVADKSLNTEKWLRFVSDEKDNVTTLWCEICKTYNNRIMGVKNFSNKYTEGTANIKLDMVKKHACSDQHNLAIRLHQGEEKKKSEYRSESENSIVRSFRKQEGHIFEGIRRLMQISYVVAKEELAFQIFPKLVELEKLHGVTFGEGYAHDKPCCEFIDCIEEATLQDLAKIVSKSSYFSVLVDGSTDSSTIERESVFIMFLADGKSHIRFLSLEKAISCDAPGVVKSIESALERIGLTTEDWKRKCIGLGCDGASVNLGVRNGVVARMRADGVPWLVGVHCYNHRLELAIKEALNKTYFTEIVAELDFLYHLYKNSPKKLRELKELGNILDAAASKPGKCYGSRWVGHKVSALKKLQNCYSIYVAHLEQLVEDPSSTSTAADKAKCKGHLSKMKRYTFVYYVNFFLDLLTSVNSLSLVLQQENINIVTTITAVGNLKDKLDLLVHDLEADQVDIEDTADSSLETVATNISQTPYNTTYLHSFEENFKHDDLSGHKQTPVHVGAIVNNVRAYIEERFSRECMEGGVLPNASLILNVKAWPVGNDALNLFGNANVVSLVKHFKTPLEHALAIKLTEEEVVEEFHILKYVVRDQFQILLQEANSMTEFWHRILICNDVRLLTNKVMKLIEILLVLPISNASVERMFSAMNRVVTDVRTSLGEQRLSSLIRISDEGCSVHDFNFEPALEIWIAKKNRRGGYKKQKMGEQSV